MSLNLSVTKDFRFLTMQMFQSSGRNAFSCPSFTGFSCLLQSIGPFSTQSLCEWKQCWHRWRLSMGQREPFPEVSGHNTSLSGAATVHVCAKSAHFIDLWVSGFFIWKSASKICIKPNQTKTNRALTLSIKPGINWYVLYLQTSYLNIDYVYIFIY